MDTNLCLAQKYGSMGNGVYESVSKSFDTSSIDRQPKAVHECVR